MADTLRLTLKFPITSGDGRLITELALRRPKRKDLAVASKHSSDPIEAETFLFARISGVTLEDIEELDLADNKALTDLFRSMESAGGGAAELGRGDAAGVAPATE